MISQELQALIRYRLEQADESLASARLLLDNHRLKDSVNRAYYAMFYPTLALLASRGKRPSKHTGVLSLFDSEFVKSGQFDKEYSVWLHRAFDLRQDSDYREMFSVSREGAQETVKQAESFVAQAKSFFST